MFYYNMVETRLHKGFPDHDDEKSKHIFDLGIQKFTLISDAGTEVARLEIKEKEAQNEILATNYSLHFLAPDNAVP